MITVRPSAARGHHDYGWLDTRHTFSFGRYHDPKHMGFRALRVINEDIVAPGRGFGQHPHDNMEIISYVLSGAVAHRDTLGHEQVLRPGEVQRMSAGTGIEHSEYNPSKTEPAHFLQIWITPGERDTSASYEQKSFDPHGALNALQLLASPEGSGGSVRVGQDARLFRTRIEPGRAVAADLRPERHAWVQVARGSITLNGHTLHAGDGAAVSGETRLALAAVPDADGVAEALIFDLA